MLTKSNEPSMEYLPKVLGTLWVSLYFAAKLRMFDIAKTTSREEFFEGHFDFNDTSY